MYSNFVKYWRQILWIVLAISIAFPLIYPLGLPIQVSTSTKKTYDTIQNLPKDSIVVLYVEYQSGNWPECGPIETSYLYHLAQRPVRIAIVSSNTEAAELTRTRVLPVINWGDKKYGIDWVYLGYLPGQETGMKSFADDVWGTLHTDFYGASFESLPMMADLKSAKDINLLVYINSLYADPAIRQFNTPFGTKILLGTQIGNTITQSPYLASGQAAGIVLGLRGAAEYDILIGLKADVVIAMDSLTLSHIVAIAAIVVGNITFYYGGRKTRK